MEGERGSVFSRKRTKMNTTPQEFPNEAEGRLGALSDALLIHIFTFLDTKEVVKTCLLSKRWQFLWTDISEIDLFEESDDTAKIYNFVDWVGRMLAMCNGIHLNKLAVRFNYETCYASNVNFWILYAIKNKVKDITLDFWAFTLRDFHVLPQMLYSYSLLTNLTVDRCVMTPRGAIEWRFLKTLSIDEVELVDCVIEKILSGCPVLEVLRLSECWGFNSLNICSPNLTTLEIRESEDLEISAPYVRDLSIKSFEETRFRLKNVSSVVRAEVQFTELSEEMEGSPIMMNYITKLFESLRSVEQLELGYPCIEVLSMLETRGLKLPPSTRLCLTIAAFSYKTSILGLLGILISSPKLETLVIFTTCYEDSITQAQAETYLQNGNLDLVLSHLKTIKINGFKRNFVDSKPILTLVQLLLKSAKALEKMVINETMVEWSSSSDSTVLAKFALKLLTFPRASPKAVVVIC